MRESKSLALPLGYTPLKGRMTGIEPASASATSWCVNHFTTSAIIQTRAAGIEPTPKVLETFVLPLYYARKTMEGEGFEPPNPKERIYSPSRLATSLPLHIRFPFFFYRQRQISLFRNMYDNCFWNIDNTDKKIQAFVRF